MIPSKQARTSEFFAASYADARARFLDCCLVAGAEVCSHQHPSARGPDGEPLFVDVARVGRRDAPNALVVISGTHGVEGFCGSALQSALICSEQQRELSADVELVLVHALNPHGFAHLRRVNEDNVDVNRNFVEHGRVPANPVYSELHEFLVPEQWTGAPRAEADRNLQAKLAQLGARALQSALQLGQYEHADGLFYGGSRPVWSNHVWRTVIHEHLSRRDHVALIDVHSGLGPRGHGERIFRAREQGGGIERARAWYGSDVTCSEDGSSVSARIDGNVAKALDGSLPHCTVTAITLEFGTHPLPVVLGALRADNWLHARGAGSSRDAHEIRAAIRAAFYCDEEDWKDEVLRTGAEVFRSGLRGLASA